MNKLPLYFTPRSSCAAVDVRYNVLTPDKNILSSRAIIFVGPCFLKNLGRFCPGILFFVRRAFGISCTPFVNCRGKFVDGNSNPKIDLNDRFIIDLFAVILVMISLIGNFQLLKSRNR